MTNNLKPGRLEPSDTLRALARGLCLLLLIVLLGPPLPARAAPPGRLDTRLDGDGKLLTDFHLDGLRGTDGVMSLIVQSDGKVVAAGFSATSPPALPDVAIPDFALARYRVTAKGNLVLDTSFGTEIPGKSTNDGEPLRSGLVRTEFGTNTLHSDSAFVVVQQADGKLVAAGQTDLDGPGPVRRFEVALARYNPDGSPDTTFGSDGRVIMPFPREDRPDRISALVVQPDGKLVGAGESNDHFALFRFNTDGTLDRSFSPGGSDGDGRVLVNFPDADENPNFDESEVFALVRDPATGKLIAAGETDEDDGDFALARFDPNGILDLSFGPNGTGLVVTNFGGKLESARAIVLDDGGLVVAGTSDANDDPANNDAPDNDFALARYKPDGTLDTTFGSGGLVLTGFTEQGQVRDDRLFDLLRQADGKLVAVGQSRFDACFILRDGNSDFAVVRYERNGSIDTTFSDGLVRTTFVDPPEALGNAEVRSADVAAAAVLLGENGPEPKLLVAGNSAASGGTRVDQDPPNDVNRDGVHDVTGCLLDIPRLLPRERDFALALYLLEETDLPPRDRSCERTPATIIGTRGDDDIRGTRGRDVILGREGDDTIRGLDGPDLICGGPGEDTIIADEKTIEGLPLRRFKDRILGGSGDDTLFGERRDRLLDGGEGVNDCSKAPKGQINCDAPASAQPLPPRGPGVCSQDDCPF